MSYNNRTTLTAEEREQELELTRRRVVDDLYATEAELDELLKDEVVKGVPANNYPDVVAAYPDSVADFITAGVPLKMDKYMNSK